MPDDTTVAAVEAASEIRYAPGGSWLIATGSSLLLLPADADLTLVEELWALAGSGSGLVDLTAALARHGLTRLGAAALAVVGPTGIQVVLRGAALVQQGDRHWDGEGRATWAEYVIEAAPFRIELGSGGGEPLIPLIGGVVKASTVTWGIQGLEVAPSQANVLLDQEHSRPRHLRMPSEPGVVPVAEPVFAEMPIPLTSEVAGAPFETLRDDELPGLLGRDTRQDPALLPTPELYEGAMLPEVATEDSYDRLFGATAFVARRPPDQLAPAPGAPVIPFALEPVAPSAADPAPIAPDQPPTSPPMPVSPVGPPAQPRAGLIAQVPQWPAAEPAPPAAAPTPARAHAMPATTPTPVASDAYDEGLTISRAELRARRAGGPSIHGVRCPAGHANPPEGVSCRSCGLEIAAQNATTMPRPPLGSLVLEGSAPGAPDTIALDGAFIVGRRPSVDRVTDTVPRLITVPSPEQDVSRSHARINVEGWHVLVTDLDSKNGTVVELPGEAPQRLHADRPTMITPGTRVVLAEVITYRYEAST